MNYTNYYNDIRKDIAIEFGLESAGYATKQDYPLTVRQCQKLNNKYGFKKAQIIVRRYRSIFYPKKVGA